MKIYVYDFTEGGIGASGPQGNGTGLCCYDDESAGAVKTRGHLDHADMSLFGRETRDGGMPRRVPFFGRAASAERTQSIGFGDLLISAEAMDLDGDINGF